jgi:hypothetical protein
MSSTEVTEHDFNPRFRVRNQYRRMDEHCEACKQGEFLPALVKTAWILNGVATGGLGFVFFPCPEMPKHTCYWVNLHVD